MNKGTCFLLFFLVFHLMSNAQSPKTRWVDDIVPDPLLDSGFNICNSEEQVIQYFNNGKGFEYNGGKQAIDSIFFLNYKKVAMSNETGLIRIRFIVNCHGESGRFRLIGMDASYKQKDFDSAISQQLMSITKSLNNWPVKQWKNTNVDYYQYLLFKIEEGNLIKILP